MGSSIKQINPDLSVQQKAVLLDGVTESPFSGKLLNISDNGDYLCANCGAKLFDSSHKFDAYCGWPSFDKSIPGAVSYHEDKSHGMVRTEVTCANCQGHLGHVFDDGPKETTGKRHCINSLSLNFKKSK